MLLAGLEQPAEVCPTDPPRTAPAIVAQPGALFPSIGGALEPGHAEQPKPAPSAFLSAEAQDEMRAGSWAPLPPSAAVNGNAGVLGTRKSLSGIRNLIKTSRQKGFNIHEEVLERRPRSRQSSKNNKALAIMGALRLRKTRLNSQPVPALVREVLRAGFVSATGAAWCVLRAAGARFEWGAINEIL